MDPRHQERIKAIQNLFASSYGKKNIPYENNVLTKNVLKNVKKTDTLIKKYAPKFPLDRIAKVDLMILRLAIYELMIEKKEPEKVIINEAVELAKEFGGERSFAFINAVLGSIVKQ